MIAAAEFAKATGGVVPRSYVTNLRMGRIENPGYEKLAAIVRVMGLPPEAWFEESVADAGSGGAAGQGQRQGDVAGAVERLFGTMTNPKTGQPFSNAEVARMSLGDLTEEEVEGIRSGLVADPL